MDILILSDCHGNTANVEKVLDMHKEIKYVFYLGDGIEAMDNIEILYPEKTFYMVSGNCDFSDMRPSSKTFTVEGVKFFLTHGHYMQSEENVAKSAKLEGASFGFYGHTHIACTSETDGVHIMNPGSISRPRDESRGSFGLVHIEKNGVLMSIGRV